jgi:3-hydroxy acid dehydrogenase / malonic semialdehyde reductase
MERTILVTGSSSGIGHAICKRLLENGHTVIGLARRSESAELISERFHRFSIDLSKLERLPEFFEMLNTRFPQINTLICNAGKGQFGHLEQFSYAQIRSLMDLNFLSHTYLVKTFLPQFKQKERADILFIGSEASLSGKKKGSIYCATKFALRGFAQALREECATSNVRVSILQPGMVRTPFYDNLDFAPAEGHFHALHPNDIADAVDMILKLRKEAVCDEILLSPIKKVISFKK